MVPLIVVAAAAAAQAHWVPLNSPPAKQAQGQVVTPTKTAPAPVAPAASPARPTVVVAPGSAVAPPGSISQPVTAQTGPTDAPVMPAGMQPPLALTCMGAGTADKARGTFLVGRFGWASAVSHHDRQFEDQIDIRLFSGDDRIRLPRTMLPGIHGGQAGWFKLKDVVADAREIHASAAVSMFHNPKIYIDRATGTISISGKDGDYAGECQVIDANAPAKF